VEPEAPGRSPPCLPWGFINVSSLSLCSPANLEGIAGGRFPFWYRVAEGGPLAIRPKARAIRSLRPKKVTRACTGTVSPPPKAQWLLTPPSLRLSKHISLNR
jgi:hypothetical protein